MNVSCIIPCHNNEDTVERAVLSALKARCHYVYAYDDHSTDDTFDILLDLRAKTELRLPGWGYPTVPTGVRGVNVARNFLIERAQDGLIIPLDADDELRSIERLTYQWQPGTWVYGNYAEHDGDRVTEIQGAAPGALPRKNITGVTFLFHKDDWRKVGGYDPDFAYAEDYAFQCALTSNGVQPKYVDTVVYDRYLHPTGNERTARAGQYWNFYRDMARVKYPDVFVGTS